MFGNVKLFDVLQNYVDANVAKFIAYKEMDFILFKIMALKLWI